MRSLVALVAAACAAQGENYYLLSPSAFSPLLGSDYSWAVSDGGGSLPLFESSDTALTTAYYFRARVLRSHMHETGVPSLPYVITEFAPTVPWAGRSNAIPCAAGHHLAEGRWLRGPGASVVDSYSLWWSSNLPGIKSNYYSFYAFALLRRLAVAGAPANLPLVASLLPNASALVAAFMTGELPGGGASAGGGPNGCVWNSPGNEGQENSLSGPGCRPLVQALLYGEAAALQQLCTLVGNATCAADFAAHAQAFRAATLAQWNPGLSSFDTLRMARPTPPPAPTPPGFAPYKTGIFCCDQAPCVGGHTRFLFEGALGWQGCAEKCTSWPGGLCHFITLGNGGSWCQVAEFCNATNPFAGDPSAATLARTAAPAAAAAAAASAAATRAPRREEQAAAAVFSGVRELASLTSPWLFGAVPRGNASAYGASWEAAFDAAGFAAPFGLRTAEARAVGYSCELGSCCWWRGPVWPFETAKALTAAIGILQDGGAYGAGVPALTRGRFFALLQQYTAQHNASGSGSGSGGGAWWISEGAGRRANYSEVAAAGLFFDGLPQSWLAESGCGEDGEWTDSWSTGYKYLHSSYLDIVITGVAGLMPRAERAPAQVLIMPLQPSDAALSWWALDGVVVGGRTVTVFWDATGERYGKGAGLHVLLEGAPAAFANTTQLQQPLVVALD
jgi:hypothetical protein